MIEPERVRAKQEEATRFVQKVGRQITAAVERRHLRAVGAIVHLPEPLRSFRADRIADDLLALLRKGFMGVAEAHYHGGPDEGGVVLGLVVAAIDSAT